jgi:hypothetical protein
MARFSATGPSRWPMGAVPMPNWDTRKAVLPTWAVGSDFVIVFSVEEVVWIVRRGRIVVDSFPLRHSFKWTQLGTRKNPEWACPIRAVRVLSLTFRQKRPVDTFQPGHDLLPGVVGFHKTPPGRAQSGAEFPSPGLIVEKAQHCPGKRVGIIGDQQLSAILYA